MANSVNFTIKGEIQTKQRPRATIRNGYARVYTPKDTILYENYIKSEYQRQCDKWFGNEPLNVCIECRFKANEDIVKMMELGYNIVCDNHKDCDNLAKIVCDALNGVAYMDDKQIISLKVSKSYDLTEYIVVSIGYANGLTLKKAKEVYNTDKLINRYNELKAKKKLTSAEKKRLADLEIIVSNGKKTEY